MAVDSTLLFETPEQMYARVYRQLRPRSPLPEIVVEFRRFAGANSFIRLQDGLLRVQITDLLHGAPAPIQEALAWILLSKLYRKPLDKRWTDRYRRWLSRPEMRRSIHLLRQIRGRKFVSGPKGQHYDLEELFAELNSRFFHGLMAMPQLGWSRRPSRTLLGHYDPSHNAIILSRILDSPEAPRLALEYVMFHEMLHLRFPVEHRNGRRCVHTAEFRKAENEFPQLKEAKKLLKQLSAG
jgi:hypothetical protein